MDRKTSGPALVFDRGAWSQKLKEITDPYSYPMLRPRIVSMNALSVADALPLQGADIVATENYWHALKCLKRSDNAEPRAHLRHYLDRILREAVILDRGGIVALLKRYDQDGRLLEEQPS